MQRLKDQQQFDIELPGKITDYVDVNKRLAPVPEMAEKAAQSSLLKEVPRYQKAKALGEKFAREITD